MAVRIPNTSAAEDAPYPPRRPDGHPFTFELIYADGRWRAYAETTSELLAFLIPGYDQLEGPAERLQARIRYAVDVQVALQARLAAHGDLRGCAPDQQALLLGSRDQPPVIERWSAPVPLLLITSFYQPAGPHVRPVEDGGEVWWLDPDDEWSLLESLAAAGWVGLARRSPEQPAV
jgi:hypothetical protein